MVASRFARLLALASLFHPTLALPQPSTSAQTPSPPVFETGPVFPQNFPDPCLVFDQGWWYTFATEDSASHVNIQIAKSKDYKTWELVHNANGAQADALTKVPKWADATAPNTWAPDVTKLDDGSFVMYFSAAIVQNPSTHCVGVATSKTVLGPYMPKDEPLICPTAQGGAIDASSFKDWTKRGSGWGGSSAESKGWEHWWKGGTQNALTWPSKDSWGPDAEWGFGGFKGQRYVVYKVDGNSIGGGICSPNPQRAIAPTPIMLQPVAEDGVTLQGSATKILDNNGVSDDGVTEAPSLVKSFEGKYVLFFSSGCYSTPNYTLSYAVADSVQGPYVRKPALLKTGDDGLFSPGGADVYWDAQHVVFHADQGSSATVRQMYVGELSISGETVSI